MFAEPALPGLVQPTGRVPDDSVIARVTRDFRSSGFRFQDMMVRLVQWTEFPPKE